MFLRSLPSSDAFIWANEGKFEDETDVVDLGFLMFESVLTNPFCDKNYPRLYVVTEPPFVSKIRLKSSVYPVSSETFTSTA